MKVTKNLLACCNRARKQGIVNITISKNCNIDKKKLQVIPVSYILELPIGTDIAKYPAISVPKNHIFSDITINYQKIFKY